MLCLLLAAVHVDSWYGLVVCFCCVLSLDQMPLVMWCSQVEVQLEGQGPWQLPDGSQDVELIHTPGHTDGSVVLLFKPGQVLFSGDHFAVSRRAGGKLAVMT